jgi:hypothetical protein
MTQPAHPSLAAGRWHSLPLAEQFANIGSEVDRAIRARAQGRPDRFERAFDRALELFDLTASDPRWPVHRKRELLRAREQFCRVFYDDSAETDLAEYLSRYFLQFAVVVRRRRPTS